MFTNVYVQSSPHLTILKLSPLNRISSILVSRLMLNLRDPKLYFHGSGSGYGDGEETTISGYGFRRRDSSWFGTHGVITTIGGDSRILAGGSSNANWGAES